MNQGTKWALLMQKNRHRKAHAWAPLKAHYCKVFATKPTGPKINTNFIFRHIVYFEPAEEKNMNSKTNILRTYTMHYLDMCHD